MQKTTHKPKNICQYLNSTKGNSTYFLHNSTFTYKQWVNTPIQKVNNKNETL